MRRSAPFRFGSMHARPPHAEPGQRIGLLGGSFNPPHAAHRLITEIALSRLALDRVWWVVTPGNPLKNRSELLPLAERVDLARTLMDDPRVVVTDFEKNLGSPFTAATLAYLELRFRGVHFVWVMGGDCLADFHRWQHWREIFETIPIAVVDRPGWRLPALASRAGRAFASRRLPESLASHLATTHPPAWVYVTGPTLQLSSTEIRYRAMQQRMSRNRPATMDRGNT
ncbi:MAG: nicotinate-nucleotide adenylyltransferase [Hyphomicrobiaceae bacterium]